jgi:hypothetical protein
MTLGSLLLILAGCVPLNLEAAVARGSERWRAATGREMPPVKVSWRKGPDYRCGLIAHAVGCGRVGSGRISEVWIADTVANQADLDLVVLHELGHILSESGKHLPPRRGVLSMHHEAALPYITRADCHIVCDVDNPHSYGCLWIRPEK